MISHVTIETPPAAYPVSVAELKAHAIIEHTADDALIERYLQAVIADLDPPYGYLGRAIMEQTLIAYMAGFDETAIALPYPPLVSVTSVKYQDKDGATITIPATDYEVITGTEPGYIHLLSGSSWPTDTADTAYPIWITYKAGYPSVTVGATTTVMVPHGIRQYICMAVAEMYRQRELSTMIQLQTHQMWQHLIERYRFRFAGWAE